MRLILIKDEVYYLDENTYKRLKRYKKYLHKKEYNKQLKEVRNNNPLYVVIDKKFKFKK